MEGIKCSDQFFTDRLDHLLEKIPDGKLAIFNINDWMEPWGFGRENKRIASVLYKEAALSMEVYDDYDFPEGWNISDSEYTDDWIITLRNDGLIGIVCVYEDDDTRCLADSLIDISNYLLCKLNAPKVGTLKSAPKTFKDKIEVPKMDLFK